VIQLPSPTGSFAFAPFRSDLRGATGNALRAALGQVQTFAIDSQTEIQERAHFQEFHPDD
jgi:hypothetical protein